ncbi:hypothetical protein CAL14_08335 [Bordetella genomosp. 9]|uniref:hypothetical protein n=1 Tax=Bordetella genomosp. 9 TaxID=1416803 RepID=UPI000A28D7C1|nr:hypothetical protein [Bordetella genomosp. 9]ARP90291.1 hypothetical protein CAL14_08335 [Bordetella genomosp. 9]
MTINTACKTSVKADSQSARKCTRDRYAQMAQTAIAKLGDSEMKAAKSGRFARIALFLSVSIALGIPVIDQIFPMPRFAALLILAIQFMVIVVLVSQWIIASRRQPSSLYPDLLTNLRYWSIPLAVMFIVGLALIGW